MGVTEHDTDPEDVMDRAQKEAPGSWIVTHIVDTDDHALCLFDGAMSMVKMDKEDHERVNHIARISPTVPRHYRCEVFGGDGRLVEDSTVGPDHLEKVVREDGDGDEDYFDARVAAVRYMAAKGILH